MDAFTAVTEEDGVRMVAADVNGFTLADLRFPPGYAQSAFEPDLPYVAHVLDGSLAKTFPRRTVELSGGKSVTIPAGATHAARFGPEGARVLVVKLRSESSPLAGCLRRVAEKPAGALGWLACRLAGELHASDEAAPLAAEGLALELLAACARDGRPTRRSPAWLRSVEEILATELGGPARLGDLARRVGVHPTHLARTFRARHGLSVGEYSRRLRVRWAAAEIARTDVPLAAIAARAGFADQSHFTRLFARNLGTTPAQYRESTRR